MPVYFAGTLNSASGVIWADPAPAPYTQVWMTDVWLWAGTGSIGNELIASYHNSGEPEEARSVNIALSSYIDSTHWQNGTTVIIKVNGFDNFGRFYEATGAAPVRNKALLGNHDFAIGGVTPPGSQSWGRVQDALNSAYATHQVGSYTIAKKLSVNLNTAAWAGEVPAANFIYVSTHGTPGIYEMNDGSPFFDINSTAPDNHKKVLMDTVGASFPSNTYPPYNASGFPPCNFMFCDACDTYGGAGGFSWVLYPKANRFDASVTPSIKNQFTAGWNTKFFAYDTQIIAEKRMLKLTAGWPAWEGIKLGISDLRTLGVTINQEPPSTAVWL